MANHHCPMCGELWDGETCLVCGWSEALDKKPHRWTAEAARVAGRKGGSQPKRPRKQGKRDG